MGPCCHPGAFDSLYINCGGENATYNGNFYESDLNPNGTSAFYASPKGNWAYSSTGDFVASIFGYQDYIRNKTCGISVPEERLYMTARLSPLSLKYYGLCLRNGKYNVILHFAEIVFVEENNVLGKRIFYVFIQDKIVLKDFNIKDEAKANQSLEKNFSAQVVNNILEIHFYWGGKGSIFISPGPYGPLISAISVTRFKDKRLSKEIIAGIVVGSVVFLAVLVLAFLWKMGWLGHRKSHDVKVIDNQDSCVTLGQIKDATQNFSPEKRIGRGGFGSVYKAELQNGTVLAVKQLSHNSRQGTPEFLTEVGILASLRHENLVRLLGSYSGEDQVLLIYEYMENNSLASASLGTLPKSELNWEIRYKIFLGVAKGSLYLHKGSKMMKIIHKDIKASNILLDRDFNAKISDFGLAKLYDGDQTYMQDKVGGAEGYIAPEYSARGHFSEKTDGYSYGVLILEIVSGRSNAQRRSDESVYLVDDAIVYHKEGRILDLIDKTLSKYPVKEATKMLNLALTCINHTPRLRPMMSEVVDILEGKKAMEHVPAINPPSHTRINVSHSTGTSTEGTSSGFSSYFSSGGGGETNYMSTDSHHDILDENAVSEQPLIGFAG